MPEQIPALQSAAYYRAYQTPKPHTVEVHPASHFTHWCWLAPHLWSDFGQPSQAPNPTQAK